MELLTRTRLASVRLANALTIAEAPAHIVEAVTNHHYDRCTFPKIALLDDLYRAGLKAIAQRVIAGEFDNA
jgi:hypothetical protein